MSDFRISAGQRKRLLEHDYDPLDFDTKPAVLDEERGVEPGDRYVLARRPARKFPVKDRDGNVLDVKDIPAMDVWFLTVTSVQRHRKGFWRVRFDITDLRDPTLWLKRAGGYQTSALGAVDSLPVVVDESVREKARAEMWHQKRLAAHAAELKARSRARRQRAA